MGPSTEKTLLADLNTKLFLMSIEALGALRMTLSLEVLGLHTCPWAYGPGW